MTETQLPMLSYLSSLNSQFKPATYKLDLINVRIAGNKILSVLDLHSNPQWYDINDGTMNYCINNAYIIKYQLCDGTCDNGLYIGKLRKGHILNIYHSFDTEADPDENANVNANADVNVNLHLRIRINAIPITSFDFSKIGEKFNDLQEVTNVNDKYFVVGSFIFELIAISN